MWCPEAAGLAEGRARWWCRQWQTPPADPSRFPGLSHQPAFPRTLPAPASKIPAHPSKPSFRCSVWNTRCVPRPGLGAESMGSTHAFHNPRLQEEILAGLFLKTGFPLEGLGTVPGGTADIWVRGAGGARANPGSALSQARMPPPWALVSGSADPRAALAVGGAASGLSHLRAPWKTCSTPLWLHPRLLGRTLKHPAFPEGIF